MFSKVTLATFNSRNHPLWHVTRKMWHLIKMIMTIAMWQITFVKLMLRNYNKRDTAMGWDISYCNNNRGKEMSLSRCLGPYYKLPKSDPNAVYLPPNAVYLLQCCFIAANIGWARQCDCQVFNLYVWESEAEKQMWSYSSLAVNSFFSSQPHCFRELWKLDFVSIVATPRRGSCLEFKQVGTIVKQRSYAASGLVRSCA